MKISVVGFADSQVFRVRWHKTFLSVAAQTEMSVPPGSSFLTV